MEDGMPTVKYKFHLLFFIVTIKLNIIYIVPFSLIIFIFSHLITERMAIKMQLSPAYRLGI